MILDVNEFFFFITIVDTLMKAVDKKLGESDWLFIEVLPDRAAWYGFDPQFGEHMARRIRDVERHGLPPGMPKPSFDLWFRPILNAQRAPKQRCVPNPQVILLYEKDCSVRQIVNALGETRANVKKMIAEHKRSHGQMFLPLTEDDAN